MLIIGLIGMPGSGKGECAKIAQEVGFTLVSMGDLVREHAKKQNLKMNDETVGGFAHSEREKFGYDIWAKRTVEKIKELDLQSSELVVIDGIRGHAEVKVFKRAYGFRFKTIAVNMPPQKRFELLKIRSRADAPMTREEFDARDHRESRWGIIQALDDADYIIWNTGTLKELEESFTKLLRIIQEQEIEHKKE